MSEIITLNGRETSLENFNRTLMYGEGVFETFRYNNGLPKFIKKHYQRLVKGAKTLGIPPITEEDYIYYIEETVKQAEGNDLYVKTILVSEGNSEFSVLPVASKLLVIVRPFKPMQKEKISLTLAPFKVHSSDPLLKIKSTNYMRNVLGKRYARENGFDDVVFLNENDEITETSSANIFWIKGRFLYTPSLDCGILPGITREAVINEAKKDGWTVVEGRFYLDDLKKADYIFVTNALNGIIRVGKFNFIY